MINRTKLLYASIINSSGFSMLRLLKLTTCHFYTEQLYQIFNLLFNVFDSDNPIYIYIYPWFEFYSFWTDRKTPRSLYTVIIFCHHKLWVSYNKLVTTLTTKSLLRLFNNSLVTYPVMEAFPV